MNSLFLRIADNTNPDSLASQLRRARFELFQRLMRACPHAGVVRILDLGGDLKYWKNVIALVDMPVEITLLNLVSFPDTGDPRIVSKAGDARNLAEFSNRSFEVVHSNSLIEHLGDFADQQKMAAEVRRVGQAYFVQTPNRSFPIEPHFLLPFFQFLPRSARVAIARSFRPGWYRRRKRAEAAVEDAIAIRLLNARELQQLFPDGKIWRERVGPLTKSLVVYREFENPCEN